jgi:tRNA nucleotidyltransferase (CCA-adding enzyme)
MYERPPSDPAMQKHDIPRDPEALRERLFAQDKELLEAANALANKIKSIPVDPEYPDTEPRALIVGGFVRDAMLGLHPKDADLEVYGVSVGRLEQLLNQLFPGRVNQVGKAFIVYKINVGEGLDFDISIPRRESKIGKGHKGFKMEGDPAMTVEDAARRRDFTMNALAADPLTGEIFDEFGGLDDLRTGTLRVTDAERFQDDPLRVYRALQFAARMDLKTEPKSRELMREMVARGDMDDLSKERITEEISKLLMKAERPSAGFELARELGIVEKNYPELHALIGVEQEPEWHAEGDVWTHTMRVLDQAAKIIRDESRELSEQERLQVMLGALCHDLGKPATTERADGRIRSLGHEKAGEEPARALLKKWSFSKEDEEAAVAITTHHLKPFVHERALFKGEIDEKHFANNVRKLIRKIHPLSWKALIAASEADERGRTLPAPRDMELHTRELFTRIIREYKLDEESAKPLLQGRDLIALGFVPGPGFSKIIRAVEEKRDQGEISTQEQAIAFVKKTFAPPDVS